MEHFSTSQNPLRRWDGGCLSGTRESLDERNEKIFEAFKKGQAIGQLAETYYLSEDTIKKIVYGRK